jgi:hypothetical protein
VDRAGRIVWACAPRVDGDPVFSALLGGADADNPDLHGVWSSRWKTSPPPSRPIFRNTAGTATRYTDANGAVLEVLTFCPRPTGVRVGSTGRPPTSA